jgi:hypothetical protein
MKKTSLRMARNVKDKLRDGTKPVKMTLESSIPLTLPIHESPPPPE